MKKEKEMLHENNDIIAFSKKKIILYRLLF